MFGSSANSKNNAGGGGANKQTIHLRKQCQGDDNSKRRAPLPPWMTVHHLPERGIMSNLASSFSFSNSCDGLTTAVVGGENEASRHATTTASNRPFRRQRTRGGGIASVSDETATLTTASNYKTKKDIALDSTYPPTLQEVHGHTRYLSECAMRIVMGEVESCVKYSLRYSWNDNPTSAIKDEVKLGINEKTRTNANEGDNHNLTTLASEIQCFFDMFQSANDELADHDMDDKQHPLSDRRKVYDDTNTILFDVIRPIRYNPNLLPIVIVKCHPNVLDRVEIVKVLISDLSQRAMIKRQQLKTSSPCVCVIRSTSELVRKGRIIAEILSQCIKNDHVHGESFAVELQQRQRKRRKSHRYGGVNNGVLVRSIWSWTRSLVDWAGYTESFDSIIVILEDPEEIASPVLDSFFTTLSSLRSGEEDDYGVPISVVVMDASPGGLGDRLSMLHRPAFRGGTAGGAVVRELYVPPPQVQWDLFVDRLFSTDGTPTYLWTNRRLLVDIEAIFRDCDNSIVSMGRMLNSSLRKYFAVPGAFISMLNCKKFTIPNEARIKWLFGDDHGRRIIFSHKSATSMASINDQNDGHIFGMFRKMQTLYLSHQICQRINTIFNLSPVGGIVIFSELHMRSRMHELLCLLGNVRRKFKAWSDELTKCTTCFQKQLNEFIILIGNFASIDESNLSLARTLVDNILTWARQNMSMQITVDDATIVQPRRDVAITLLSAAPHTLEKCPLAHARQIAFRVFQSRVMTLADWHEKYFDVIPTDQANDSFSNESAFSFATHELVHMGFVKKLSSGKRKEETYEKIAIIWGNGR